jgi:hypothetical protein
VIREVQGSLTFMASGLELAEESRRAANEGAPERRRVSAAGRVGTSRGPRETGGRGAYGAGLMVPTAHLESDSDCFGPPLV